MNAIVVGGAAIAALLGGSASTGAVARSSPPSSPRQFLRANQVGYRPDAPKVAVLCALDSIGPVTLRVADAAGRTVLRRERVAPTEGFGPCVQTVRLDFTAVRRAGRYTVTAGDAAPVQVRIGADVWRGGADTLLQYMREQRSGWNPVFRDSVHRYDGIVVDDPDPRFMPVSGGWADASDYLQYVTTSATATYHLLLATRDHPGAFADAFQANGTPGSNGVGDALDEARHGLQWLLRMNPSDRELFNQLGDDRDHQWLDLLTTDSSDYGWGKGKYRPIYPCTGRPQGLFRGKNRSTGVASTAGKYAAAYALASRMYRASDPPLAAYLARKASVAYEMGRARPGVCQTAPGTSPYFYEEENWVDDMELAAAELHALTGERRYLDEAIAYAKQEPVTPWMGADTARHYEWYPWHNNGHYALWRTGDAAAKRLVAGFYRQGIERVIARAGNGFRIGIPFIWCSNNLVTSFATQAMLYRRMTGDARYREYEQAAIDWLFGTNPWGVSMVVGYPRGGRWARDPHSVMSMQFGAESITGGLLDGPVYRSIYSNLRGIRLAQPDEFAEFNTGRMVYHDDQGDYSTNEPIMDGTASLAWLLAALGREPAGGW